MAASSSSIDEFVCSSHPSCVVALWCQNCELLICPKCIAQGPSGSETHRNHEYWDLSDAYNKKQEEFKKVMENFADATQSKKNDRAELQGRIQSLKFELLRKKSQFTRELRMLKDAVTKHATSYERHLEGIVASAITRQELLYTITDFEVVNREGLLGCAESVQKIQPEKCIQYLRGQTKLEKDMVNLSATSHELQDDNLPELQTLKCTDLHLRRERQQVTRTFTVSDKLPSVPRFLPSWSIIAATMATIVFKCSQRTPVDHFMVDCTPVNKRSSSASLAFKIRKFSLNGRITATLRNLSTNTQYRVGISAVSRSGVSSSPAVCYIHTPSKNSRTSGQMMFKDKSRCRGLRCCRTICCGLYLTLMFIFLLLCLAWTIYALYLSYDEFFSVISSSITRACDEMLHLNMSELDAIYERICPEKIPPVTMATEQQATSGLETEEAQFIENSNGLVHSLWDYLSDFVDALMNNNITSS